LKLIPKYRVGQRVIDLNGVARKVEEVAWSYAYFLEDCEYCFQPDEIRGLAPERRKPMANRDKQGREKKKPKKSSARAAPAESRARRGSADRKEQTAEQVEQAKAAASGE
jgi:hypothetical protein